MIVLECLKPRRTTGYYDAGYDLSALRPAWLPTARTIRWLPDTSDPFLLSRLQADYEAARRWYCAQHEGYHERALQAQKRLAQAIRALSEEP